MFAPGTRVELRTAIDGYPPGTEAIVVFDLGDDVCQIALSQGDTLDVACSLLRPIDADEELSRVAS